MEREKLTMTRSEALDVLIRTGDIIPVRGKYALTGNFHRDFVPVPSTNTAVVKIENKELAIPTQPILTVRELVKKFVKDADIPFRIKSNTGQTYTVSAVSKDAELAFSKILKTEGINYEILVYSTKMYYKRDSFRKILTNYLKDGDWEVEYEEFKTELEQGNIQNHITQQLTANQTNIDSL